jgi:hypothetical protein
MYNRRRKEGATKAVETKAAANRAKTAAVVGLYKL